MAGAPPLLLRMFCAQRSLSAKHTIHRIGGSSPSASSHGDPSPLPKHAMPAGLRAPSAIRWNDHDWPVGADGTGTTSGGGIGLGAPTVPRMVPGASFATLAIAAPSTGFPPAS